ncbi:MAG: nitrilase family protein [Bacteroidetes bacterium]|nr:nitrilase family protein [Bacteroidota bacterium]
MEKISIATAQFEHRSGDKAYNLDVIERMTANAALQGARAIAFHECSITGYTFARRLSKEQMLELAEPIPEGPSVKRLAAISGKYGVAVLAGLFEKDEKGRLFKAYVCVDKNGVVAKFRKLHPFINPHITPGSEYCVFDLFGWKCGILICYDNNIIEHVRATRLLGAEIIFMPHVTMGTPSPRPGAGFIDPRLWENREADPTSLRLEFEGMKGRQWLMKWLPARAYDNGVYCVFSNAVGMDDDQVRNGRSMIIDPFGDILSECTELGEQFVMATLIPEKLQQAGGYRYIQARRPELYRDIIGQEHRPEQKVAWMTGK